jgi:uncharacterized damage-inducible protein DinB
VKIAAMYAYLVRARRDLWETLDRVPDEILSKPLLEGERFHCIKDLVMHIAIVEDCWLHEDILQDEPIWKSIEAFKDIDGSPIYASFALNTLLEYWKLVEQSTLRYLASLREDEAERVVALHDSPEERYALEDLLWHVMLHELRHTAQVCILLRTQKIKPPSLDLLFYLPQK